MRPLPRPGSDRRRSLSRLALVLAGLVAVVWYQWRPAVPAAPASNLATGAVRALDALTLPEAVRLADLDSVAPSGRIGRDPFVFGARPVPAASPASEPSGALLPPPAPPAPEGPPPIALRLTGMLVTPGTERLMVTLRDPATGALYHAFEGDAVDGRYRIVKVGLQSIVVSYVDGSGPRTLALGN